MKPLLISKDATCPRGQSNNASTEAPALLVAAGDGSEMVNYRVRGDYYVVDKLFDQAVLVSGVGREQDRVSIRYTGAAR
jgi:type IV secretion system protein VirB9